MDAENKLKNLVGANLQSGKLKVDAYDINYVKAGSGPNLLLLHGANIGWGQWHLNIPELSKYFTVYAIDFPGSGFSTKIDFKKLDLERDFVAVVKEFIKLKNLRPLNIIGHSIGGWVALKIALSGEANLEKLVLVNSLGLSESIPFKYRLISIFAFARLLSKTIMRPTRKNMKKFLADGMYDVGTLREEFVDYFYESVREDGYNHPFLLISRLSGLFKMQEELILLDELSEVRVPVLVILGDKDPLSPLSQHRRAANLMPQSRFEVFLNTAHVPFIEKDREFNSLVIDFLKN